MFVTYDEYLEYGYNAIPEVSFVRYIYRAGVTVQTHTFDRVTDESLKVCEDKSLVERNKRGICEVAGLQFDFDNVPTGEAGAPIKSFSNEGYSETLADRSSSDARRTYEKNFMNTMLMFFTTEQLSRVAGV